jgi:hypothetical protein
MAETWQARHLGQRALGLMAGHLGLEVLGPEDLLRRPRRQPPGDPLRGGGRHHRPGLRAL